MVSELWLSRGCAITPHQPYVLVIFDVFWSLWEGHVEDSSHWAITKYGSLNRYCVLFTYSLFVLGEISYDISFLAPTLERGTTLTNYFTQLVSLNSIPKGWLIIYDIFLQHKIFNEKKGVKLDHLQYFGAPNHFRRARHVC